MLRRCGRRADWVPRTVAGQHGLVEVWVSVLKPALDKLTNLDAAEVRDAAFYFFAWTAERPAIEPVANRISEDASVMLFFVVRTFDLAADRLELSAKVLPCRVVGVGEDWLSWAAK